MYESGCRLVVITNQSGIGRGLFSHEKLGEIHRRLFQMVESIGARLEGIYYCPHLPGENCQCRKPGTALGLRAAQELGFAPSSAFVIGDKDTDIEFGRQVGATTILLAPCMRDTGGQVQPDFVASNLVEAATLIARGSRPQ
jgi:histidinol-phosphate phosphatase family protein